MKHLFILFLASMCILSACKGDLYDGSKTPEETIASFQLADGFTAEVFAAEPFIKDPVEMIFDGQGRVFAVEMPDYPFMPEPGEGIGRIVQLFDRNNDGTIDDSSVFAEGITEATSILPWKDGLLVTAAPDILYIKDTDGDGKVDSKEVLFTGFFENNSEAQVTNLTYGVDNWIYASNHGQAGKVKFVKDPDSKELITNGGDFRFRMDDHRYENVSGTAQFGQTFNDEWQRFITQNTIHIRHSVIPDQYLKRHNLLPSTNSTINISDHDLGMFQMTPPPYWRAERTRRRQIQYKEQNLDREEYAEDHFTGSSGGTYYDGQSFPEEFYGSIFTGDVAGNLVHRDILEQLSDSPTFVAKRPEGEKTEEFLASTDSWFRPASFTVGPDGYLYIVDMYRQHIETPLSIPEDLKEDMDFMEGDDKGRIYRIKPTGAPSSTDGFPDFRNASGSQLVEQLGHPNRWFRLTAQRLLIEKQDKSVTDALMQMLNSDIRAYARLHALYTLDGLGALQTDQLMAGLKDSNPGVRKHSIILSESHPDMIDEVATHLDDDDIQVVFQACLSVGSFDAPRVTPILVKALSAHYQDTWFRMAVLSAPQVINAAFLDELSDAEFFENANDQKQAFVDDLGYIYGQQQEGINHFLDIFLNADGSEKSPFAATATLSIFKGIDKAGNKITLDDRLKKQFDKLQNSDEHKKLVEELSKLII